MPFMTHLFARPLARRAAGVSLLLATVLAAPSSWAERADRAKRLVVESDTATYDELKRITLLTGNVVITKGTLVLKAERVEVREGADGYRTAVAIGGSRQATFRQKRDAPNEYIDGQADRLEYEERREAIRFVDNATVRLLRGNAVGDEITGNLITYDGTSEVFNVSGGRGGANAPGSSGRVRAVLAPREGTEAAEAARAAGAQEAASAPPPGGERR